MKFDFNGYFLKVAVEVTKEPVHDMLLYEFNESENARESARHITAVYRDRTICINQCQQWF